VDFSFGPETQLNHLTGLKDMALIAALQSVLDAEESRADEWTEGVGLQLKLAGTLDDEPTVISHLVRGSIIRMAVKSAERNVNRATPGEEACRNLQFAFTRAGATNLLPLAFIGERALMIPVFRLSRNESQSFGQEDESENHLRKPQRYSGKPPFFLWLSGLFERDLNFFLQSMEKSVEISGLPAPENLCLTNYLREESDTAQKRLYILSGLFLPSLSSVVVREASTQARIELATTAMAVERFRLARGRLPSTLSELTPKFLDAVPPDPFDGAPLRYRLLDSGYVIYSIDADGHDDGGREAPEHRKSNDSTSYDITFIVSR